MPPVAQVQRWPSNDELSETLRQLEALPVNLIGESLDWLLKDWSGCAIQVVENSYRLPQKHCDVVRRWGESSLWPGNYDPTGLQDPPNKEKVGGKRPGGGPKARPKQGVEPGTATSSSVPGESLGDTAGYGQATEKGGKGRNMKGKGKGKATGKRSRHDFERDQSFQSNWENRGGDPWEGWTGRSESSSSNAGKGETPASWFYPHGHWWDGWWSR